MYNIYKHLNEYYCYAAPAAAWPAAEAVLVAAAAAVPVAAAAAIVAAAVAVVLVAAAAADDVSTADWPLLLNGQSAVEFY